MSRKRLVAVLAILVAVFAGYAWAKVIFDFDPNADFSSYKTYGWLQRGDANEELLPDYLRMRLQRVTEDVLATKGLEPAPAPPQTDLLLTYTFGASQEFQVDYIPYSVYQPWGYGYWGGYGGGFSTVRQYTEGTLVLDIVDARTHQLVWTGSITKDIQSVNPPGDRIEKAITKLLKNFPPKPPKN
jgi:hypothetical protein